MFTVCHRYNSTGDHGLATARSFKWPSSHDDGPHMPSYATYLRGDHVQGWREVEESRKGQWSAEWEGNSDRYRRRPD